jgi:hypothetical protein
LWAILSLGSKHHDIVSATSSSANSKSTHPLLPLTTKLWGGATEAQPPHILGENEEATESLEISIPLSQSPTLSKNDAPLMQDIAMLMDILSDLVQHENPKSHDLYKEFLEYGQQR